MDSGRPVRKEAGADEGPPLTISRTVVVWPSRPAKTATPPSVRPAPITAATTSSAARLRMPESIEPRYSQATVGRSLSGCCARVKGRDYDAGAAGEASVASFAAAPWAGAPAL